MLALAGDDFTNLMNEVADISLKFAETPVYLADGTRLGKAALWT